MQIETKRKMGYFLLLSDKMNFNAKTVRGQRWALHNDNRVNTQQQDTTIVNIHVHNIGTPKCIMQIITYLNVEIDNNAILVGDLMPHRHQCNHPIKNPCNQCLRVNVIN